MQVFMQNTVKDKSPEKSQNHCKKKSATASSIFTGYFEKAEKQVFADKSAGMNPGNIFVNFWSHSSKSFFELQKFIRRLLGHIRKEKTIFAKSNKASAQIKLFEKFFYSVVFLFYSRRKKNNRPRFFFEVGPETASRAKK